MATAADLIRRSLKLLGVLAAGESLRAEDQADGLIELNLLLSNWANERLQVFGTRRATYTLTPSLSPHTIGSGGTFNTTRPLRIDGVGVIPAGTSAETPLDMLTDSQWRWVGDKTATAAVPSQVWVEETFPAAKLWLWPVPTTAATLVLYTWSRIAEFAAADSVSLPDGYEDALGYGLALRMAPMFGIVARGTDLEANAAEALDAIKRTNSKTPLLQVDSAVLGRGSVNLVTGGS